MFHAKVDDRSADESDAAVGWTEVVQAGLSGSSTRSNREGTR